MTNEWKRQQLLRKQRLSLTNHNDLPCTRLDLQQDDARAAASIWTLWHDASDAPIEEHLWSDGGNAPLIEAAPAPERCATHLQRH
jgi:hypothetical protein